ncbi:DUF5794 domain-containing protein [Halorubrum vacuolatum]|uniref:Uncharacterized protein n=1 Tax=Halorubrum vacuolatum TaxID=63740 RepID=A0A238UQG4_HALVU|nr:DUF5794 domain-containing protein [Halorubrum vacuolatum]SNR23539.1 hypothetical protein SAMN06264855_101136 [Halorubrum vacuolatum]
MSVSRHPIALRLEQRVGGATKLLATVMALPLIDGIFPALVVAGVLATPTGVVETGILIFGGSATMAVILAEMDGTRKEMMTSVLLIGAVIIPVAAVEAALAPTLEGFLNLEIFERFAGLVILAIAAKTASSEFGKYLPSPAVIIGLGLIASFDPSGLSLQTSTEYVVPGTAAASIGVGFALAVAAFSPQLKGRVDIDRFRFGSAVALGVLALPILLRPVGVMQTEAPIALAVLAVTALFAYDPDPEGIGAPGDADDDDDDSDDDLAGDVATDEIREDIESGSNVPASAVQSRDVPADTPASARPDVSATAAGDGGTAAASGDEASDGSESEISDDDEGADDDRRDPFDDGDSRAPWL